MRKKIIWTTILTLMLLVPYAVFAQTNSSTIEVTTLANTPADVVLERANDTSLEISWSANGNPSYTKYTVEYSLDKSNWFVAHDKVEQTNATISGLQPKTNYYVRVASYNLLGETNGKYAYLNGEKPVETKPSVPDTAPKPINDGTLIEWENTNDADTIIIVDGDEYAGSNRNESPRRKSLDLGDLIALTPDTKYEIQIVYENESGRSAPSDALIIWTDANPAKDLKVIDKTVDSITVSIDPNGNPLGKTQYEYTITDSKGLVIDTVLKTDTEHTFENLLEGTYTIKVSTFNSEANTNQPAPKKAGELEILASTNVSAPTIQTVPSESSIMATLTTPQTEGMEFRIVLYDASGNELGSTDWAKEGEGWAVSGLTYTFEDLQPNTQYKITGEVRIAE